MTYHNVVVSGFRHVYTYALLYEGARFAIEQAEGSEKGSFYNCMSSIILCAFCIEAYLNHVGSKLLPYWDDKIKKDLSTESKLKIVCERVEVAVDFSEPPFQSFRTIRKFRNLMAHGKTEILSEQGIRKATENGQVQHFKTWWEEQCTIKTSKRMLEDTQAMVTAIHKAAGYGDHPLAAFGIAGASVNPV
jgi:hypothetical protein